jgi:hypothetical protein
MAIAWTDLPLTQNQRDIMLQFEALGQELSGKNWHGQGALPGVVPVNTVTQAKRALEVFQDLGLLVKKASAGVHYTLDYHRAIAAKAFEDANP